LVICAAPGVQRKCPPAALEKSWRAVAGSPEAGEQPDNDCRVTLGGKTTRLMARMLQEWQNLRAHDRATGGHDDE
jgi:hypothetical protein